MNIGKARAYTNIALIKYWGKTNEELILPTSSSLSLTLDAFYTETSVVFDNQLTKDVFYLNGQKQTELHTKKITYFLSLIRQTYHVSQYAIVTSKNFVPTAAGLASSASGLAALAGACNEALDLGLSSRDLSRLARRGSGSACRSIFGGFVEWEKGTSDSTSYGKPIDANGWEEELAMLFVLIDDGIKDISSRDGMKRTVETSCFYDGWLTATEKDLQAAKKAIAKKEFIALGEVMEASCLKMHGTTLGAIPPFTYWSSESLIAMQIVRQLRQQGISCYFTMDAGPNVKVLMKKEDLANVKTVFAEYFSENQLISASAGPGLKTLPFEKEDLL